jgi:hypothetical protein
MNEKIKELSQKAGAIGIWNDYMPFQGMVDLDKFAELIVLETLEKKNLLWADGDIKTHFGIEENKNVIG